MSYAICNVVCGYHLDGKLMEYVQEADLPPEAIGFEGLYSAGGSPPMYCGICIYEFDECTRLRAADLLPHLRGMNREQYAEAKKLLVAAKAKIQEILNEEDLTESEKEEILACIPDEPDIHLVFGSS